MQGLPLDVKKGIEIAVSISQGDEEVARLVKVRQGTASFPSQSQILSLSLQVVEDFVFFNAMKHVHLPNLTRIAAFAAHNKLSPAQQTDVIRGKEKELGYFLAEPTVDYQMLPHHYIGRRFHPEPVTAHRPPRSGSGSGRLVGGIDAIDKVLYINLEHRTDRAEACEEHLGAIFGPEKVERFDATLCRERPLRGCNRSHIRALERVMREGWALSLICEDDVEFRGDRDEVDAHVRECLRACAMGEGGAGGEGDALLAGDDDGWDVIMFGAYLPHSQSTGSPFLKRTRCATTSHCYLINGNYARTLRNQIERSLELDLQFDLGWWPLQWRVSETALALVFITHFYHA